jgi:hypothetical protein
MSISVPTPAHGARLRETDDDWFARQDETLDNWADRLGETIDDWLAFLQTSTHGPSPVISEEAVNGIIDYTSLVSLSAPVHANVDMLKQVFMILRQEIYNHIEGSPPISIDKISDIIEFVLN